MWQDGTEYGLETWVGSSDAELAPLHTGMRGTGLPWDENPELLQCLKLHHQSRGLSWSWRADSGPRSATNFLCYLGQVTSVSGSPFTI